MPLKVREVIKLLERNGWRQVRTTGDHRVFRSTDGRITVVSGRAGDDCPSRYFQRDFEANWYQGAWTMTRKYSLVIEGDSTGYSAYVPELPAILVTGRSHEELTGRATEAIRVYWDSIRTERSPTSTLCEIEIELPA